MKNSFKISMIALCAMFAFNTTANAQFGGLKGLANKVKKAAKETVNNVANDARKSVSQQAESTVSESTGVSASCNESEVQSSSPESSSSSTSSQSQVQYSLQEISGAKQSNWTITSPQSELVANVKYYARRMQDSFSKGYKGLDYEAYNMVRFSYPSVVDVLKSTARSDYDNAVNDPVKMLDNVTLNFLKIATNGLPPYQYGDTDKSKFIDQLNFFINRGKEMSGNKEAQAFFFAEVWDVLKSRTQGNVHLEGGEAGLSDVESYLQQNVASQPEAYKWRYPATLNYATAKTQYNTNTFPQKRIAQLRAYTLLKQEGKYGTMNASANPSMEKKALSSVTAHRSYWGKAKQAWVGPVTSTKKNHLGQVITKYRSVKVLCEDQGFKVIHNFALYEKVADGSIQMTGFGWENGDKDIELAK